MKKYRFIRIIQWILLNLIGAGLIACGTNTPEETATGHDGAAAIHEDLPGDVVELTTQQIRSGEIRVEESREIRLQEHLTATGTVAPNESRVAQIRPLAKGVIEKVHVRRGDRVQAGDPLIRYDNIELGELIGEYLSQRAQLQKYLAEQEVARKFLERGVELLDVQAIARKEVELREAQLKNAQAMVEAQYSEIAKTEEKLHRFGLSEEEIVRLETRSGARGHRTASHNTLRAPFAGVITEYDVAEGELVEPSRELLTVADVGTVWVLADIYEKDLGRIREGQDVEIVTESYPDEIFRGRLTYVSDVLERETRTARVRCVVPNPGSRLKLEMFVTVRIPTLGEQSAVAVPESAIQNIDGREVVFVAEESGRFRVRPVTTGVQSDGWIEAGTLAPGTPVVSDGSFYLKTALKRSEIEPEHGH